MAAMRIAAAISVLVFSSVLALDAQPAPSLKIVVLEGEGAVNIIQQKTAVRPLVEVRDRNNLPVAGAAVTFTIGGGGQGAAFAGGVQTLTVTTNAAGQAAASGLNALSSGAFQIQVQAAYQGQIATAAISQTNFATAAAAAQAGAGAGGGGTAAGTTGGAAGGGGGGISSVTLGIVGAAVGGGAFAATQVLGQKEGEFQDYNGSLSGQIVVNTVATNPQGQQTNCFRTRAVTGTAKIQLTPGSGTGKAEVQVNQPELSVSGQCNPSTQVDTFGLRDIPVTGGPSALTFTKSEPLGPGSTVINTVRFNGSLSGTTISGNLTIEIQGSPSSSSGGGSTTLQVTLQK